MKATLLDTGLASPKHIRIKEVDQFYLDTPFHFHDACEIVLIKESYGKRVVGDHIAHFNEGDLVLLGSNLPHIWQNDNIFFLKKKGFRVRATVIYFLPSFVLDLAPDEQLRKSIEALLKKASRGLYIKGQTQVVVGEKLNQMEHETGLKKISLFLEILDFLTHSDEYEFLASERYNNSYTAKDTGRFNDVYQYLINNFHRTISLKEIALVANMSPTAFCRYFKNRTHKSLTSFLTELRIKHACKLLQNEQYSISDVCYECGFNNLVNFSKSFKSIIKTTPSAYKRNFRVP